MHLCIGAYGEHSSRLRNFEGFKLVTNLKETKEAKCKKCNGVIQNLGTDVSEKHFRTKSVSVLHPILSVYFNILSPGLGPHSNFEIVIIIFEFENIG